MPPLQAADDRQRHPVAPGGVSPYNRTMHVVAIGWLYVTLLMALTEKSIVGGVLSFVFYGLLPVSLLLWLFSGSARRRRRATRLAPPAEQAPRDSYPPGE